MIISRTPFRVSFFGGGTDFPEYYREHGGATLLTAIDKYCYLSLHRLGPFFRHRFRASYAQTELVQDPSEFKHPLIRESLLLLGVRDGLEVNHIADLPGRTGLGSSSSFTVGLLNALHTFLGRPATPEELARESIEVERVRIGDAGGHQDQYAAAYGGLVRVNFGPGDGVTVHPLLIDPARRDDLQSRLLMFYLGVEQSASEILQEQTRRTSRNTEALRAMLHMVNHAQGILCSRGDLDDFGRLLHDAWQRKKSLASGISNSEIDAAYAAAMAAGALGGKLLGAGGRGFLLVYADPARHDAVRLALRDLREVRFSFAPAGSQIVYQAPE